MRIIAADDESIALEGLETEIRKALPEAEVSTFRRVTDAVEYAKSNPCDIAFLDIQMREINGIEAAKILKEINPAINIIFTTAYSEYMPDAFKLHASGYIMKPVTHEKISAEIEELRHPVETGKNPLKVQCFGNFEVFSDGRPLKFSRSKTKELLAYLIDRKGAAINTEQLCAILWEDKADTPSLRKQLRTLISDLRAVLRSVEHEDVFISSRNSFSVDTTKLDCDFYDFCNGNYTETPYEYMAQYSWADINGNFVKINKLG